MPWLIFVPTAALGLLGLARYVIARPQPRDELTETILADAVGSSLPPSTPIRHVANAHANGSLQRPNAPDERDLLRQRDVIVRETVRQLRRGNAKWPRGERSALATLYADSITLGEQKRKIDTLLVTAQGTREDSSQIALHVKLVWSSVMRRFGRR